MCPYSKRLVPQSWNALNGISQRCSAKGELIFLSTLITEASLQSRMWSSPTETLIAKGSSQNLVGTSTTRIVSHYMTSFLVLHHERVRYRNGLLKPRQKTIDDITLPGIASTICKNPSTFRMQKLNNSSAKESISTQYANKCATRMLGTITSRSPVNCQRQMQASKCRYSKTLLQQLINELPLDGTLDGWKN
jgi:hypothetical protein